MMKRGCNFPKLEKFKSNIPILTFAICKHFFNEKMSYYDSFQRKPADEDYANHQPMKIHTNMIERVSTYSAILVYDSCWWKY